MKQLARLFFQGTLNLGFFRSGLTRTIFWLSGKQPEERDLFTIIVIHVYLAKTSIFCFVSEVGTGSSSHDFDGDFMMSSLISVTQVGSNTESLQCVSLCGCVCDRMVNTWGKERRMF